MKHKTLFRLLLKAIGVWLFFEGVSEFLGAFSWLTETWVNMAGTRQAWLRLMLFLPPAAQIAAGLYLFFGGKWVANMAIPSNRPYCHECGYDLTGAIGTRCNECGTPFRAEPA